MEEEPGGWSGSAARQLCGLGPPCVSFPRPLPHGERGLARPLLGLTTPGAGAWGVMGSTQQLTALITLRKSGY